MTERTGRKRSPRSFANTVAAHSTPQKVRCKTTATQTVGKQLDLNGALQMATAGMMMGVIADALKPKPLLPPLNREQLAVMKLLTTPDPIWRGGDGRRYKLSEMADEHLENAIGWMYRRFSELDLCGDDRSIERQCISHIWIDKLQKEQKRREDLLEHDATYDSYMDDSLDDWPEDW